MRFGIDDLDMLAPVQLSTAKRGLDDGLDIVWNVELEGKCEDCIYGKQMAHPYDQVIEPEMEMLEQFTLTCGGQLVFALLGEQST